MSGKLPEPEYEENSGGIRTIFYKDKYTEKYLEELGLNEQQKIIIRIYQK